MTTTTRVDQTIQAPPAVMLLVIVRQMQRRAERLQPILGDTLQDARRALDALPLASDDYSRAVNGLRNVQQYSAADEYGAARYELMLLERQLNAVLNPPQRRSRPRRRRVADAG